MFCKYGKSNRPEEFCNFRLGALVKDFPFRLNGCLGDVLECWLQRASRICAVGCTPVSKILDYLKIEGRVEVPGLLTRPCEALRLLFCIDIRVLLPGVTSGPSAIDLARSSGATLEVLGLGDRAFGALFIGFFLLMPVMLFRLACIIFS